MAIYKFRPILKSVIWGGEKIAPYKGITTSQNNIGESWELSGVKGNESVVSEGASEGLSLSALIRRDGAALLGERNFERFGEEFPLLIKFIDARDDLSIQVHPNDELAARRHNSKGKTEMWYVVDADKGAHLRSGFARKVTPEEYAASVEQDTICDLLCDYEVHAGDLFFLPAGRIHSIGAGSFIAEIQQTSDVTYRIYDFNRRDAAGNLRELHTEQAIDAIDYTLSDDYRTHYSPEKNSATELVRCPYFTTELWDLDSATEIDVASRNSFVVVICIEGEATLRDGKGNCSSIHRGETVLVAADSEWIAIEPQGEGVKLLTSHIE